MRLVIMRHGIAVEAAAHDGPDATRPLTPAGVRKTERGARGLAVLGAAPGRIVSSPLVRAVQTAEIVAKILQPGSLERAAALQPEADPRLVLDELAALAGTDDEVLLVGHLPHLDRLIAHAVHRRIPPFTSLGKAGAACLELDPARPGTAVLRWLLEPRALRKLAGPP